MKVFILFILLICSTLQTQTAHSQSFENQIDYFQSNPNDLLDENGNSIFHSIESDSLILTGETTNNNFGYSLSSAGDVNGDGFADVIVGAVLFNHNRGRAYIFYGGLSMDNIADVILTGEASNNFFGKAVSSAGDVNDDGYSDVIVGAVGYNSGRGRAYIFYGGAIMNNMADVIMTGENQGDEFGYSVSSTGDVNGDGYSDVIVGADIYPDFTDKRGRAYIFFGGGSINNVADVTMTGEYPNNYFGISVSDAGDLNNDGYSDVIVGAKGYNTGTGRAYIFNGGFLMDTIPDIVMTGQNQGDDFGIVSSAGDVNGDGFDDVIIGANNYENFKGRAYIFNGGFLMDTIPDIVMTGQNQGDDFGIVSSAGDVNGDGFDDVIVSANQFQNFTGRSYIFYGDLSMDTTPDLILTGNALSEYFGFSVSSAGDVNGDGYSDVIVGSIGYNSNTGRAYLYDNLIPKPELINPLNNSINNSLTLEFNWKKFNMTIYYILVVSTDSKFNNIIVNDTVYTDTSKIVSGFQKDTKYFWRVRVKDTTGVTTNSVIWNFTTVPPLYLNATLLFEGMYSPAFNQLIRKDSVISYLHQSVPPFAVIDSANSRIDSISFSGLFKFYNAVTGAYYISVKHLNSIETWSKAGGEYFVNDGTIYTYDFTIASSQAFGNNLKSKGTKYCLFSGDVNQDGFIDLFDVVPIYNDATNFISGNYLATDLTGDGIVDLTDVTLCYNNSTNFIRIMRP